MSGLVIGDRPDGSPLELPLEAVTEPMGLLAVRRAGKSNAAVVIAEQMFAHQLHWVAIDPKGDWWGIRAAGTGPGLPIPIFGGKHGDIPLEPGAGILIADLIVDQRVTCVLDLSMFESELAKIRFLLAFSDRLFRRKDETQEPTHVFFEEADDYVPQRAFPEQQRLVHSMAKLLKQGGSRGIGGTVISQRSAVVNKDILSQVQTLFALRNTGTLDRKAIRDWVSFSGENPEIVGTLAELDAGEAWVWSPSWLKLTERFQFRRRSTFDSGDTPKIGASRRPPATLADVDLGAIASKMAETIERSKADDPQALKARIAQLEAAAGKPIETVREVRIEVPVLSAEHRARIAAAGNVARSIGEALDEILTAAPAAGIIPVHEPRNDPAATSAVAPAPKATPAPKPVVQLIGGEERFAAVEVEILDNLAHFTTERTAQQVATMLTRSSKSSGYQNALSRLRTLGLIVGGRDHLQITDAGRERIGPVAPLPTGAALLDLWLAHPSLGRSARLSLAAIAKAYPRALTTEEVAAAIEASPKSSGFQNSLSTLRSLGLITGDRSGMTASPELVDPVS